MFVFSRSMIATLICAAVFAAVLGTNAEAAFLANVEGVVSINHGDGYRPAGSGAALVAGDRVRTIEGSTDLLYENGCSLRIGPHQTVAVMLSPPPCKGAEEISSSTDYGVSPLVLGGLVVVGGGVGLAVALSNDVHTPVSP
jgi:hypothetical protein